MEKDKDKFKQELAKKSKVKYINKNNDVTELKKTILWRPPAKQGNNEWRLPGSRPHL